MAFDVDTGPDGSVYLLDAATLGVRKIDADTGVISQVAGTGACASWVGFLDCGGVPDPVGCDDNFAECGDNGPATEATLGYPQSFEVTADGSIFIGDTRRLRRVTTDGIIQTVSGAPGFCFDAVSCGDGGRAVDASWGNLRNMAEMDDGSLLVSDDTSRVVRRIAVDGTIDRWAGEYFDSIPGNFCYDSGFWGSGGVEPDPDDYTTRPCAENGEFRLDTPLPPVLGLDVGPDGAVFIATGGFIGEPCQDPFEPDTLPEDLPPDFCELGDYDNDGFFEDLRLIRVAPDGTMRRYAGTGRLGVAQVGQFATTTAFDGQDGFSIDPAGVVAWDSGFFRRSQAWGILDTRPPIVSDERFVPDGDLLHVFDENGRHLRSEGLRSRTVLSTVAYDAAGRVASVTDRSGNVTTVQRDAAGTPLSVTSPYGDVTALALDGNDRLRAVTNPESESTTLTYAGSTSLLASVTGARPGSVFSFGYDDAGRLISATDPVDGTMTIVKTEPELGVSLITTTRPGGDTSSVRLEDIAGDRVTTESDFAGLETVDRRSVNGTLTRITPDGTETTTEYRPDPQYGGPMPFIDRITTKSGSRTRVDRISRELETGSGGEIEAFVETAGVLGEQIITRYDLLTRTITATTAEGRVTTVSLDPADRVTSVDAPGFATTGYAYDANGRLIEVESADGLSTRTAALEWDGADLVSSTDPLTDTTGYSYDLAGRPVGATLPDSGTVGFGLDPNGNREGITVPSGETHTQVFDLRDRQIGHIAPGAGDLDGRTTTLTIGADGNTSGISRADGGDITFTHEGDLVTGRAGDAVERHVRPWGDHGAAHRRGRRRSGGHHAHRIVADVVDDIGSSVGVGVVPLRHEPASIE